MRNDENMKRMFFMEHPVYRTKSRRPIGWDLLCSTWTTNLVSKITHYENMKDNAKCIIWGWFGELEVTQGHRHCHHPIERLYDVQLHFNPIQSNPFYFRHMAHRKNSTKKHRNTEKHSHKDLGLTN